MLAGSTLTSLCRQLETAGLTTPRGGRFRISTLRAILLNPRNAALRAYGTEQKGDDGRTVRRIVRVLSIGPPLLTRTRGGQCARCSPTLTGGARTMAPHAAGCSAVWPCVAAAAGQCRCITGNATQPATPYVCINATTTGTCRELADFCELAPVRARDSSPLPRRCPRPTH